MLPQHAKRAITERSLGTMHQIGLDLIHTAQQRLAGSGEGPIDFDFRDGDEKLHLDHIGHEGKHKNALKGRDLLSLLSKCYYPFFSFRGDNVFVP